MSDDDTSMRALYALDVAASFSGPLPADGERTPPEVGRAHIAAVEAMEQALRDHGFEVVRVGHGATRVGSFRPSQRAVSGGAS